CTNFMGVEQAARNNTFTDYPYGRLNAKMKASFTKTQKMNYMQGPTLANICSGESSSHHQTTDDGTETLQQEHQQK
ncbi:hypothetical protein MKX03_037120, partial [Papaver bracteatum]